MLLLNILYVALDLKICMNLVIIIVLLIIYHYISDNFILFQISKISNLDISLCLNSPIPNKILVT